MVQTLWKGSAPLTAAGLLLIAALAAALTGLAIDPRIVTGAPVWLKPAKFAVSNAIYLFTLAWIFTLIPEWTRTRRLVGWTTAVILVMETAIIGLQAFRGTTSHFNVATVLDGILFGVMGVGILVWTQATIVVAVVHVLGRARVGHSDHAVATTTEDVAEDICPLVGGVALLVLAGRHATRLLGQTWREAALLRQPRR